MVIKNTGVYNVQQVIYLTYFPAQKLETVFNFHMVLPQSFVFPTISAKLLLQFILILCNNFRKLIKALTIQYVLMNCFGW